MSRLKEIEEYITTGGNGMPAVLRDIAVEHNCTGEALAAMIKKVFNDNIVKYQFLMVNKDCECMLCLSKQD